jgi:hypothetical protein
VASLATSSLPLGANMIIAVYDGDNTFASSQNSQTVTIAPNATATITSSANNVALNATPTYTVTINGNAALGVPAGTVQFKLTNTFTGATTSVGSAQTLTPGSGNTATASVVSTALANPGSYLVTVVFTPAGSSPYAAFAVNTTTATSGTALIETVQQTLKPGDLVAVQRGDGTVNLGSSGYLVFLDEYTTAGVLVQKIALPNASAGSANALLLSGQNGAEGLLNRSANGQYLTLAGYDLPVGRQFVTSTFPFQFGRTIARIDGSGNVDTSTVISTTASSSVPYNPLDVVSNDGNEFWLASNLPNGDTTESGIEYVSSLGATSATQLGAANTTAAALAIANGQLYAASNDVSGGSAVGVWHVGSGLPTTTTALSTLPGLQAAYQSAFPNAINPEQLLFLNTNDGTSNNPNVLYIADLSNGLLKFWFDGANWNFGGPGGSFGQKLIFSGGAAGVSGYVINPGSSAQVQLYVTGSNVPGANPNQIVSFLDKNAYNAGFTGGIVTTLAFVGATGSPPSPNGNENFAGLAFAPGSPTTTTLTSSVNPAPVGTNPTFTATVSGPAGLTGSVTFSIDGVAQPAVLLSSSGVAMFTPSTPLSGGPHTITAAYSGDLLDAGSSATLKQTEVGPFAGYVVTVVGSSTIQAGVPVLATVQAADSFGDPIFSYSGPSSVTATIAPTSTASNFPIPVSINANGLGFFLVNLQKAGTYTITVANGTFTGSASPVTVVPGAAAKLGFGTQPVNTPTGVTLPAVTVQVLDAFGNVVTSDSSDTVIIGIASGPGSFTGGSTTSAAVHNGVATFNTLTLVKPGSYTLSEVVTGLYTGPTSNSFTVAPLQVVPGSFAGTPTGFALQFNGPYLVNSTTPALFGSGFGAGGVTPSVTLTGMATGTATVSGGKVTAIAVTSSVLYTSPPTVTITGGSGSGAQATAVLKNGGTDTSGDPVISVTVTNQGSGYTSAPTVTFSGVEAAGTVILNTATNSLTFVATNTTSSNNNLTPVLPDGQYVAVVHGTAAGNGFQSTNSGGGFLDGTSSGTPGHDFTATYTVGAAAASDDIVWTPATADGPLQKLSAPGNNQGTLNATNPFTGYPVYINDSTGNVTSVTGTFNFNPNLLNVTGGTTNGLLPGSTFTVTVTGPGTATFTYTDGAGAPNKGKLTGGNGSANAIVPNAPTSAPALGFITATVPNSSAAAPIYRAKDLLSISNAKINGSGTIPVIGGSAVHLVAFVGDGDGNGSYSSGDAVLITRVLVSADTGFAAYPLVDPTIVADTDGSGFIPSDSSLQANEAGVGFPTANVANPPIPTSANVTPIGNNVDPSLSLPGNLQVGANGTVTVPVNLDDAHPAGSTGLLAGHLVLRYDPRQFSVSAADIHLGSLLAGGGWSLVPTIDQATGEIGIALSSSTPIRAALGGSLVMIDFHAVGQGANLSAIELVASASPNGQPVSTELEDAQGTFTLTPAPSNNFSPATTSLVVFSGATMPSADSQLVATGPVVDGPASAIGASANANSLPDMMLLEGHPSEPLAGAVRTSDAGTNHESGGVHDTVVSAAGASVSLATGASPSAGAFTGVIFQVATFASLGSQGVVENSGRRASDVVFQGLVHGTSPLIEASLMDAAKAIPATFQSSSSPSPLSDERRIDVLSGDQIAGEFDWQGPRAWRRQARAEEQASSIVSAPGQELNQAAVDGYFSMAADETDAALGDD